jgi:hypothetical protein
MIFNQTEHRNKIKVEQNKTVLSGADTKQKTTTHKTQMKKDNLYDPQSETTIDSCL